MKQIKERNVKVIVNSLPAETIHDCEVNVRGRKYKILVEEVEYQF